MSARLVPGPTPRTAWARSASWEAAPLTVTVNDELTGLLESSGSVAVHVTVVWPMWKLAPGGGEQLTEGGVESSGSVAAGATYVTNAPAGLVASTVTGAWPAIWRSLSEVECWNAPMSILPGGRGFPLKSTDGASTADP